MEGGRVRGRNGWRVNYSATVILPFHRQGEAVLREKEGRTEGGKEGEKEED